MFAKRLLIVFLAAMIGIVDRCRAQNDLPSLFQKNEFTAAEFIEAVNYFIELGEDAAVRNLDIIGAKEQVYNGFHPHERVGWMCRVLFDSKNAEPIRQPFFGGLSLPDKTMPSASWPRYPVALSGSTYFVLSEGYTVAGTPEDPSDYIEHCRNNGVFRSTKLEVPTKAQALLDAAALRKSKAWTDIKWTDSGEGWWYEKDEESFWQFIQKQAENIRDRPITPR